MIRFVDLTAAYWGPAVDPTPCCAFIDTVTDRFIEGPMGPIFDGPEEVTEIAPADLALRCIELVPERFFAPRSWER